MPGEVANANLPPYVCSQVLHEPANAGRRIDQLVGDDVVELVRGEVVVHQLGQQHQRGLGINQFMEEQLLALFGLGVRFADDGVHHGQHLD